MDYIAMNEKINKFSRVLLHSEDYFEKSVAKYRIKKAKLEINMAVKAYNSKNTYKYDQKNADIAYFKKYLLNKNSKKYKLDKEILHHG